MLSDKYARLCPDSIKVHPGRQRSTTTTKGLKESISARGIYNPILVTEDGVLVAGGRRLKAAQELNLVSVPVRYVDQGLSLNDIHIIELEENLKREELSWQDQCKAFQAIHDHCMAEPGWSQAKTADLLGVSPGTVSYMLRVAQDLADPHIASSPTAKHAYGILNRQDARRAGDILSDVAAGAKALTDTSETRQRELVANTTERHSELLTALGAPPPPKPQEDVLNVSFLDWAPAYAGRPFNVLHCDFPYGQGEVAQRWWKPVVNYANDPEAYWPLVKCLCGNLDRIMSISGHIVFWFSMNLYYDTIQAFSSLAPSLDIHNIPLVWHKTDNAGVMPPGQPRRTYEVAFLMRREERPLVRAVAASHGAPTDSRLHPSAKPEPMLMHFLQMVVDENTRLLDPTCGGGSALRAAERLGAAQVLGLEIDPIHAEGARKALNAARVLRKASQSHG